MENVAIAPEDEAKDHSPTTKAEFLVWSPDDGYLYEWDNGIIIQQSGIKKEERYIIRNIQKVFRNTAAFTNDAALFEETDCWRLTSTQKRIPDIAYLTNDQIKESALVNTEPIPAFVAELISPGDKATHIEKKVLEYAVIWHIYPELAMVRVFT